MLPKSTKTFQKIVDLEDERKELIKDVSPLRAYRGDSPDTVVSAYFNASSSDEEKRVCGQLTFLIEKTIEIFGNLILRFFA